MKPKKQAGSLLVIAGIGPSSASSPRVFRRS